MTVHQVKLAAGLTALGMLQLVAPGVSADEEVVTTKTVVFSGLFGFVKGKCVDPSDKDGTECADNGTTDVKQVRAIAVDSREVMPKNPESHGHRTSHQPWLVIHGDPRSDWPKPDDYIEGLPAWNLRGRLVQFLKGSTDLDGSVQFNQTDLLAMKAVTGKGKSYVWRNRRKNIAGAMVHLNGGSLQGHGTLWTTKFREKDGECVNGKSVDGYDELVFTTKFDGIRITGVLSMTIGVGEAERKITILNRPISDGKLFMHGHSDHEHFKEYYDLADEGRSVDWEKRCNLSKPIQKKKSPVDKTVFCPPVIFGKD